MSLADNEAAKQTALDWVAEHRDDISRWNRLIWDYAEPSWREYKSARFYVDLLRKEGFTVEEGSGGMPTAFCATWSNGPGPTVMTFAEYDGVPNNNQAATTKKELRDPSSEFACGHTDPHSTLGISTLGGLLATKRAMEAHGIGGTLRYTGEPGEKMLGSKVVHGLRGYYDNVDALISFHPFYMMPLCNTVRWDTHCGTYQSKVYSFVCDEPETWQLGDAEASPIPAAHASARAPGANAALMTMYNTVKAMQDSMLPAFGGWYLNEALLGGGQATADNLSPFLAQIQYSWRCPDLEMAEKIEAVLDRNAQLAAEMAHCKLKTRWVTRTRPGRPNHTLASLLYENYKRIGPPKYDDKAIAVAQDIQRNLGMEPMEKPFLGECEKLVSPQDTETRIRNILAPWQKNWTADDYVEMTHYTPTVRFYVARPALAIPEGGKPYPSWVMNALGGIPETIDPTFEVASRVVALTLIDMLTRPDVLAEAKREFDRRSADYPAGPLLPKDFKAPVDLPWPDYVHQPDGTRVWHPLISAV